MAWSRTLAYNGIRACGQLGADEWFGDGGGAPVRSGRRPGGRSLRSLRTRPLADSSSLCLATLAIGRGRPAGDQRSHQAGQIITTVAALRFANSEHRRRDPRTARSREPACSQPSGRPRRQARSAGQRSLADRHGRPSRASDPRARRPKRNPQPQPHDGSGLPLLVSLRSASAAIQSGTPARPPPDGRNAEPTCAILRDLNCWRSTRYEAVAASAVDYQRVRCRAVARRRHQAALDCEPTRRARLGAIKALPCDRHGAQPSTADRNGAPPRTLPCGLRRSAEDYAFGREMSSSSVSMACASATCGAAGGL